MRYDVRKLVSVSEFELCASLMVQSSPWKELYFTKEQCEADLARPELLVHGAVSQDGSMLGFLASLEYGIGFEPMIEYLCVDERFRSRGIGTGLIDFFESKLFPDADNLYLFVSDINPDAIRLYVRLGYLQVGALPNFNLQSQTEFLHRKSRRPRQLAQQLEHEQ
jgi:ribosomal protein S18 acetylase RimI-like enzyme